MVVQLASTFTCDVLLFVFTNINSILLNYIKMTLLSFKRYAHAYCAYMLWAPLRVANAANGEQSPYRTRVLLYQFPVRIRIREAGVRSTHLPTLLLKRENGL